ncbi:MAG: hypothetical protein B9S32_05285 [Verrucomicrobia bacterium Tous-C9LFEB]|nr:MAG: hypothetical protein B9S32_05285 [Verrucomicrobia bacterium Tous-C9LFEB]
MKMMLKNGLLIAVALLMPRMHAVEIPAEVKAMHDDIWQRFISPHGIVLDYNTLDGKVEIPNADECENGKPNALSWWTPIENGPFFSGLYLDAIVRRWKLTGSEVDRAKAKRLADGLILCASVSEIPGFVARGVAADGKSHYALGSDDQTGPWFYGLWRYVRSGAATGEEKKRVEKKMVEVAEALRANHWFLPADPIGGIKPGQTRGSFHDSEYRGTTRLLFITRILFEITGDKVWQQAYEEALSETFKASGKTRLEHLTEGIPSFFVLHPHMVKNQLWLFLNSQGNLRELIDLEKRPEIREKYLATLRLNAKTVAGTVVDSYSTNIESIPFKTDWRSLNTYWKPQATSDEATKLALDELREWKNAGRGMEITAVREPFCAAAIIFMAPDRDEQAGIAMARFQKLLRQTPWDKLYSSYGIFAELAWYAWMESPGTIATESALATASTTPVVTAPASSVGVEIQTVQEGAFRCSKVNPLVEIPAELQGKKIYTINRGPTNQPGAGFKVTAKSAGTAWLLMMSTNKQEPGPEWELTSLQIGWIGGGRTFKDKIYRRTVTAGIEIVVPPATGKSGDYYSIPHALVLEN